MSEKETLILLDFKETLASDTFEKDTFIRVANLNKKNPLVQINDTIFEGKYDHAMGTNLFFDEIQDSPPFLDPFLKRKAVQYECKFHGIKTISLKQMKIPPPKITREQPLKDIEFNLDWDYNTLLQKFADGSLRLHDIIKEEYRENLSQNESQSDGYITTTKTKNNLETNVPSGQHSIPVESEAMDIDGANDVNAATQDCIYNDSTIHNEDMSINDQVLEDIAATEVLKDYQKLRELAFRPVRRKPVLDKMGESDEKYKKSYEYHNLEKQILQPCDFFRNEPVTNINEETLSNCVDIDRCVLYGLLDKSTDKPRILTKEEKRKVLSLDNFDNISLGGRYYVLKTHVDNLEKYFKTKNIADLSKKDKYGRTPLETLEIYKKLSEAVKNRIEDVKASLEYPQIKIEVQDDAPGPSTDAN